MNLFSTIKSRRIAWVVGVGAALSLLAFGAAQLGGFGTPGFPTSGSIVASGGMGSTDAFKLDTVGAVRETRVSLNSGAFMSMDLTYTGSVSVSLKSPQGTVITAVNATSNNVTFETTEVNANDQSLALAGKHLYVTVTSPSALGVRRNTPRRGLVRWVPTTRTVPVASRQPVMP